MNSKLLTMLIPLLKVILNYVTPQLAEMLREFLVNFYLKAKTTPNPVDDLAAAFLLGIFGIPTPTPDDGEPES